MTASSSARQRRTFSDLLADLPRLQAAISAALAALLPLLLPDRLVPQQLSVLRSVASLIVIVAFLAGWIYRRGLQRRRATLVWLAAAAAIGLGALQIRYVQELPAIGSDLRTEYYLVGYALTPHGHDMLVQAGVQNESLPVALRKVGPDAIPALYGDSYQIVSLLYTLCALAFVFSAVVTLTASDFRSPRPAAAAGAALAALVVPFGAMTLAAQAPARRAALDSARATEQRAVAALQTGIRSNVVQALGLFRRAEAYYLEAGDSVKAARNHGRIGLAFDELQALDSALTYYEQTLTRQRRLADTVGEGRTRLNRGNVLLQKNLFAAALEDFHAAEAIARHVSDSVDELFALHNIGWAFQSQLREKGQQALYDSAARYYRQTLAVARAVRDTAFEANAHARLGSLYENTTQLDSAVAHYEAAVRLYEVTSDPRLAAALSGLGWVYASLKRHELALSYLRRASRLYGELEDALGKGMVDTKIAAVEADRTGILVGAGRGDSIVKDWQGLNLADSLRRINDRALSVLREDSTLASRADPIQAQRVRDLSRTDPGMAAALAALLLARVRPDKQTEGLGLEGVAQEYLQRDSADAALAYLDSALVAYRTARDRFGEVRMLMTIGWVHHRLAADLPGALAHYDTAAAVRAGTSGAAGTDPNRISLHEQDVDLFSAWALARLASPARPQSRAIEALAVVERGRAQALLALLGRTDSSRVGGRNPEADGARLIRAGNGLTRIVYWLAEDTLLVWLADARGTVTLSRRPLIRSSIVPRLTGRGAAFATSGRRMIGRDSLTRLVGTYRGAIDSGAGDATARAGRALADVLLPSDIQRLLPDSGEIVIVPFGPLGLVPFAALPGQTGEPFGTHHAIRYAPSLGVLNAVARGRGRLPAGGLSNPLIVGNPKSPPVTDAALGGLLVFGRLAGADSTARWLGRRLGAHALIGEDATETAVRAGLAQADLVDLETHGYVYSGPELVRQSFITLTADARHDGVLTVGDLLDSLPPLKATLVVLSACETGLGDPREAEGIVGLARAVLARGAGGVLISLWNVDDRVTGELVRAFYDEWLGPDHPTKAEALRRAQVLVRRAHPDARHWAAFQLIGE